MTVLPAPPKSFAHINLVTVPEGVVLHRVHSDQFDPAQFNPCQGAASRFSPIHDVAGPCIPSLYAADTFACAVFETVFHDIPFNAKLKTVRLAKIMDRSHSIIVPNRDLTLITLHAPDLAAWTIARKLLIDTLPSGYANTARWAAALQRHMPKADGLIWTSRPHDPEQAMLFFGDRLTESDFDNRLRRDAKSDPQLVEEIRKIGKGSDITIIS